jgi:hypothetical protein
MGRKLKHTNKYYLVKGGNSVAMGFRKMIAARFYQLKLGHGLRAQILGQIRTRPDMQYWWSGHECLTTDHLVNWCTRLNHVQKRLWVDGQERQYRYEGVRKVLKKPKISLHISLVLA